MQIKPGIHISISSLTQNLIHLALHGTSSFPILVGKIGINRSHIKDMEIFSPKTFEHSFFI